MSQIHILTMDFGQMADAKTRINSRIFILKIQSRHS